MPSTEREANTIIGQRIAAFRIAAGKSLEALAAEIGVSKTQLQKYESGATIISAVRVHNIAKALDVPLRELTGDGESEISLRPSVSRMHQKINELSTADQDTVAAVAEAHAEQLKRRRAEPES